VLGFLSGSEGTVISLKVQHANGKTDEIRLVRQKEDYTTLYHKQRTGDIIKLLPNGIGYVDLDRLTFPMIDEVFMKLKDTKAIVFDMRGYPLGTPWFLAPRVAIKEGAPTALLETPIVGYVGQMTGGAFFQTLMPRPAGVPRYEGKTVMLIDERTQSQAELMGMSLRAANGTTFIGSPTAGANGEVTNVTLPGGITMGFTGQAAKWPDGRQLQRLGLKPDVPVKETIKGIRAGRDEVLEAAIKYVSS
jgi:C-terminal processing protease CtpA/Prc